MQETKLSDDDAPVMPFQMRGYSLVHHGEGRWNGVAIASKRRRTRTRSSPTSATARCATRGAGATVSLEEDDFDPFHEARMVSAVIDGIRFVSLYAPNGRVVGSAFYAGKLAWYDRLLKWLRDSSPTVRRAGRRWRHEHRARPTWTFGTQAPSMAARTYRQPEREAFAELLSWGLVDGYRSKRPEPQRFTWWDYRAGNFHKNLGMRIDHLLLTPPVAQRARVGRDRSRGAQGRAHSIRPRAAVHRPRRARRAARRRLGGRARAHRRTHQALAALTASGSENAVRSAERAAVTPRHWEDTGCSRSFATSCSAATSSTSRSRSSSRPRLAPSSSPSSTTS